jgi:hypothetical protein
MSDWLNACEGIVATAIPVVGLVYTYTGNRRVRRIAHRG